MNDTKAQAAWHPYRNAWEAAQAERAKREEEERQAQVERMTRLIAKRGAFSCAGTSTARPPPTQSGVPHT